MIGYMELLILCVSIHLGYIVHGFFHRRKVMNFCQKLEVKITALEKKRE